MTGNPTECHIQSILRPLEELEAQMSKLYRWFHEKFREDEEASFVFYRMSLDEKAHVGLVQYQRRLARQNPTLFAKIHFDLEDLTATRALVDRALERGGDLRLEGAVKMGLELEGSAAEMHLRTASQQPNDSLARLVTSLGAADFQHVKLLKDFAVKRGFLKEEGVTA
jgi:rubrerythrin